MMSPPARTPALPGLPHTPSPGIDHSFPQEGLSSCIPLPWTLGPADPSGLFSCSPRQGLLCFCPRPALGALDPSPSAGPTLHPTGSMSTSKCTVLGEGEHNPVLHFGFGGPHGWGFSCHSHGHGLWGRASPEDTPGPGGWGGSKLVPTPFFQMYQKEKQVLEELSRHTGTSLQPLSRGLF